MSRLTFGLFSVTLFAVWLWSGRATAQMVLKPNRQAAMPLRVKSLTANVSIDGQFAATRQTLLFQNETSERIEADFLYTLPPNTLVTSFAYWYGDEKVPARVVEKEEAAAIYQHITTRQHDPALVEMVGKNTFRARIFPVMPNADLKVEMTLVQTLPSDAGGASFTMPLVMPGVAKLDHLNVHLTMRPDPAVTDVTNNYGLPIAHDQTGYHLTLTGVNYRPDRDLRVHLRRSPRPFHAALCVTPTDADHGYFALALTPQREMKEVTVRIGQLHVSEVTALPEALLRSHRVITLVGKYAGQGLATVALNGEVDGKRQVLVGQLQFGPRPLYAPLAGKLWGAAWMARLSEDGKNRGRVMQLSYHFGLPSKYTSWLAVPREEMEQYKQEIADAKLEVLSERLATLIRQGQENTPLGKRLKRQLYLLAKRSGHSTDEYLGQAVSDWLRFSIDKVEESLKTEYLRSSPDVKVIRRLNARYETLYQRWTNGAPILRRHDAELQVERIRLEAQVDKLELRINVAAAHGDQNTVATLKREQDALVKQDYDLGFHTPFNYSGNYPGVSARQGDPLIRVQAPPDARQVVAVMPDGEVKLLLYDTTAAEWEARFDIPTYAPEGDYVITIIIVQQNGERHTLTMRYHVDLTPPKGTGRVETVNAGQKTLRLELVADEDTARVKAVLPWGAMVELGPSSQPHRFFALVPIPANSVGADAAVTFIVTDRAHNRTIMTVEMEVDR